ncbi:MAG TPA: glutamate--tRNA ligase family protein, partial [Opitutales bacterium]|nr:glutamate--tRNA ligase family protein [Opitutales bacterium]
VLLDGLRWLGLDWDEGPEVGGNYGPYFQSERGEIYKEYIEKIKASGRSYEQDGALYFKVSEHPIMIEDLIRGRVERQEEKDFVIVRSNGQPVFHFVNVVDDITMKITHIVRGEDHLSNTSKHVDLYNALGAEAPKFAHIPLILKTHGSGKMSKRDQGALIEEYENRHFLPEAVRNFLCLLGWSPKNDREILPIEEIIQLFELTTINKNNAHFDEKKLAFINGEYTRALPLEDLIRRATPILSAAGIIHANTEPAYLVKVLAICQPKLHGLEDLVGITRYFFTDEYPIDDASREKMLKKGSPKARLEELLAALQSQTDFSESALEATVVALAAQHSVSTGEYIHPARFALSGQSVGPSFYALMHALGSPRVLHRIQNTLKTLS